MRHKKPLFLRSLAVLLAAAALVTLSAFLLRFAGQPVDIDAAFFFPAGPDPLGAFLPYSLTFTALGAGAFLAWQAA